MSDELKTPPGPGPLLEVTVFVCGALVMIYEIVGSRIVAPYIGASTYVWTSLIGVILAALSLGYWLGGSWADRVPSVRALASALFVAGGLVSATILGKDVIMTMVAAFPAGLEFRSVLAALILFAPASVALGFVIPYATKIRLLALESSGKTVGRLYALSTLGSIAGTFAAGFVLIPFVGSVRTLYLVTGTLFLFAVLLGGLSLTRNTIGALTLFVFGIAAHELGTYFLWRTNNFVDLDTEYSRIRIFDSVDPRVSRELKVMMVDPHYVQSARYLDGDDLALEYTKFYHLVRHFRPGFERSLMIGGAGYSFPQDYLKEYPTARIDVAEIDPGMTAAAEKYFGLQRDERLSIAHEDGRVFVNNAPDRTYDAVFIDAFGSLFSVPFQLTTIEAAANIKRILKDDGVVIFNVGSAITGDGSLFLHSQVAVYRSMFPDVRSFKVRPEQNDDAVQNVIMVARNSTEPIRSTASDDYIAKLLATEITLPNGPNVPPPTDELAPIEYYSSLAQKAAGR
ncbi:MAG: fused MFS/spermidine synthase [Pyrinomonadaceae bacterium]|nr:fused MFS/spermidine synthase [Pyrinomonadaceae bacterium]